MFMFIKNTMQGNTYPHMMY